MGKQQAITVATLAGIILITAMYFLWPQPPLQVSTASALQDFVANNQYEPFAIPRNKWGAGTVISFNENGSENIVWRNDECLRLTSVEDVEPGSLPHVDQADVSLATSSYRLSGGAALELSLAKGIAEGLELSAGLQDSRVAGIEISINSPREHSVSDGRLKRRIVEVTESGDDCTDDIFTEGRYVIDRVLTVEQFSFAFKSDTDSTLKLDAKLMDAINMAPELRQRFEGTGSLASAESRMVGYRLFKMMIDPGLAEGGIEATRVDPAALKREARQK